LRSIVNEDLEPEKKDSGVDSLWDRALAAWDDDKVHSALIEYAVRTENLPEVAGRYRALEDDPQKGARAKKQLNAIVVAATQMMFATKAIRPENARPPWWMTASAAGVCFFLLLLLVYAMLRRH
jgi:hypothetical protein